MGRRGVRPRPRDFPVRPLDEFPDPLHGHGQEAAAPTGALGFPQFQAAGLTGRSKRAGPPGRQHVDGVRPAAALVNGLFDDVLAVDPEPNLSREAGSGRQHSDLQAVEHQTTLRCALTWHRGLTDNSP